MNITDSEQGKPIHYAAACCSDLPLKEIISAGGNINDLDRQKRSALIYGCRAGREHTVRYLLGHGNMSISPDAKDRKGMAAIHYACIYGHLNTIRILVQGGANINLPGGTDRLSPLAYTVSHNKYTCAEYLISQSAKVLMKDKYGRSPLIVGVRNGNIRIVSLLLKHGSLYDEGDSSQNTPLHYAMAYGWPDILDLLLSAGCRKNAENSWKITPLGIGMLMNQYGMVKRMLEEDGVEVDCKDQQGRTMISLLMNNHLTGEIFPQVEYLLRDKGAADPNILDLEGNSPLHHLIGMGIVDVPKYNNHTYIELTHRERINYRAEVIKQKGRMIELLMKYKCDINTINKQEETPLSLSLITKTYELSHYFSSSASFSTTPSLLFQFPNIIYSDNIFQLFKDIIHNKKPSPEQINRMNDEGYTPFLTFLRAFVCVGGISAYENIKDYLTYEYKLRKVKGSTYFDLPDFNITYDKYSQPTQHKIDVEEYYLPPSDIHEIERYTKYFWETTISDKFLDIINIFQELGADLSIPVGKLRNDVVNISAVIGKEEIDDIDDIEKYGVDGKRDMGIS